MSNRIFGMAPGGRMSLDRAANRRRNIWHVQNKAIPNGRPQRPRERRKSRREGEE